MRPGKASHGKYRPVKKIDSSPLMLVMNCSASGGGGGGAGLPDIKPTGLQAES